MCHYYGMRELLWNSNRKHRIGQLWRLTNE
jgi:hypothetical protein